MTRLSLRSSRFRFLLVKREASGDARGHGAKRSKKFSLHTFTRLRLATLLPLDLKETETTGTQARQDFELCTRLR